MNKYQGVTIHGIHSIQNWSTTVEVEKGIWTYARPLGDTSILWRIKCAWKVLKCEYDVVEWKNNQ